jgi:Predicted membrane protein (DUF2142)
MSERGIAGKYKLTDPTLSPKKASSQEYRTSAPGSTRRPQSWLVRLAPRAVLLGASVALSLTFWPGPIDADAISQIAQARSGHFLDWWAPILDWLWRILFLLHLSPGFVLLTSTTIFLLSVYELLRSVLGPWAAVGITLAITLFPPVLGFLGSLQRDTWFGAIALAAYALIVRAYRSPLAHRPRLGLLSLVAVWIGMAARQNGFIVLAPAAVLAVYLIQPARRHRHAYSHLAERRFPRWSPKLTAAVGGLLLMITFAGSQWLVTYQFIHARHTYPQQALFEGDLATLSLRTGEVLLPPFLFPAQDLQILRQHSSPYSELPLVVGPHHPLVRTAQAAPFPSFVSGHQDQVLEHDWLTAVLHHPGDYLLMRWKLWTHLIGWGVNAYEPYHNGFDGNLWNYHAAYPALDKTALRYLSYFSTSSKEGGVLYYSWVYLCLCLLVSCDLLRRSRTTPVRVIGCLCASVCLYYVAYFFLAMGFGFRWAWLLVVSTLVGVCVNFVDHWHRLLFHRRESPPISNSSIPS